MQLSHNTVVLIVDGRKMLFLRNEGDGEYPTLTVEHAEEQENPATNDQVTDRAGRASSPQGASQSSVGGADAHDHEEERFAAEAAALLKKRALAHEYDRLIVIAPPRTLGALRKHYHGEVSARLIGELDKDLTGHPIADIEKAIAAA